MLGLLLTAGFWLIWVVGLVSSVGIAYLLFRILRSPTIGPLARLLVQAATAREQELRKRLLTKVVEKGLALMMASMVFSPRAAPPFAVDRAIVVAGGGVWRDVTPATAPGMRSDIVCTHATDVLYVRSGRNLHRIEQGAYVPLTTSDKVATRVSAEEETLLREDYKGVFDYNSDSDSEPEPEVESFTVQ